MSLSDEAAALVDQKIAAYNAHDLDAFVGRHADDRSIQILGGEVVARGQDEIRTRYARLFAENPRIVAAIPDRTARGQFVVDLKRREKLEDGTRPPLVVIYEVGSGAIRRVWVANERS